MSYYNSNTTNPGGEPTSPNIRQDSHEPRARSGSEQTTIGTPDTPYSSHEVLSGGPIPPEPPWLDPALESGYQRLSYDFPRPPAPEVQHQTQGEGNQPQAATQLSDGSHHQDVYQPTPDGSQVQPPTGQYRGEEISQGHAPQGPYNNNHPTAAQESSGSSHFSEAGRSYGSTYQSTSQQHYSGPGYERVVQPMQESATHQYTAQQPQGVTQQPDPQHSYGSRSHQTVSQPTQELNFDQYTPGPQKDQGATDQATRPLTYDPSPGSQQQAAQPSQESIHQVASQNVYSTHQQTPLAQLASYAAQQQYATQPEHGLTQQPAPENRFETNKPVTTQHLQQPYRAHFNSFPRVAAPGARNPSTVDLRENETTVSSQPYHASSRMLPPPRPAPSIRQEFDHGASFLPPQILPPLGIPMPQATGPQPNHPRSSMPPPPRPVQRGAWNESSRPAPPPLNMPRPLRHGHLETNNQLPQHLSSMPPTPTPLISGLQDPEIPDIHPSYRVWIHHHFKPVTARIPFPTFESLDVIIRTEANQPNLPPSFHEHVRTSVANARALCTNGFLTAQVSISPSPECRLYLNLPQDIIPYRGFKCTESLLCQKVFNTQ